MSCLNPISIVSKAIGATAKQRMLVPCNHCIECYKAKQRSWVYRLQREQSQSGYSLFVTLTYDPAHVPLLLSSGKVISYQDYIRSKQIVDFLFTLNKSDLTKFFKRLRKSGMSFNYFASGEYGDQFDRPHYHVAFFFNDISPTEFLNHIDKSWSLGSVVCDPLTDSRIFYITKYLLKTDVESAPDDRCVQPYSVCSHGIGVGGFMKDYNYYQKMYKDHYEEFMKYVTLSNGVKVPVPRYFRSTILCDECEPFTIDVQLRNEQENFLKQSKAFDSYVEKFKTKMGVKDIDTIARNYSKSRDSERQTRIANIQRRRRKGI